MTPLVRQSIATPLGEFVLVTDDAGLVMVAGFEEHLDELLARRRVSDAKIHDAACSTPVTEPVAAYFDGELRALDALRTSTVGTLFQGDVWAALRLIKPATTWTYSELAAEAGHPTAVRAAANANAANPLTLIVPCHRVVPTSGGVGGYSAGPFRKRWLLRHEAAHAHPVAVDQAVGSST